MTPGPRMIHFYDRSSSQKIVCTTLLSTHPNRGDDDQLSKSDDMILFKNTPPHLRIRSKTCSVHNNLNNVNNITFKGRKFTRRKVFSIPVVAFLSVLTYKPSASYAGEVGRKITQAVTQSDLGLSVRTSVVRGAQTIDALDGKWERFSDTFGLGQERSKREKRPLPYDIPDPLPLNSLIAAKILTACDETFITTLPEVSSDELTSEIKKIDDLVRKSFERGGLNFSSLSDGENSLLLSDTSAINYSKNENIGNLNPPLFNYFCYIRFKAYCNIIIFRKIPFNSFRNTFESMLGKRIVALLLEPDSIPKIELRQTSLEHISSTRKNSKVFEIYKKSMQLTDCVLAAMKSYGLISLAQSPQVDPEILEDWISDIGTPNASDLEFSLPIDGDITLKSQLLLQEQGFRLYPNFGRFALDYVWKLCFDASESGGSGLIVIVEEYYMDTNYNSDPNLFEAKQVLLNFVIES
eukprot:CAMPEP_0184863788 /NCGR_PEP_ID=MMETSP0580-20130426/12426_1 /TAXON_ID=1118495 /ORGANISM="Dactyliosolen fragilissimus" /LENGTH=464 /DNA_ID=CAMNT_0027362307 /DNA_START=255 /DNA_END=1649 /DNA_ORIENTATION=+